MKQGKRVAVMAATALLGVSVLTGCYNRVSKDQYANTVVATYGNEDIYLDEVNFFLKMQQVTYDYYYEVLYGPYYGFSSAKEFYENTSMTGNGTTLWSALKEEAMAGVLQTHILCERAAEYNVSLTEEDEKKIAEAVEEFMTETDEGILDACMATEELVTRLFTQNALANRVYEYLVADIDTEVDEAEYRYTQVAYYAVQKASKAEESSSAAEGDSSSEAKEVDLEKKADEVLAKLEAEIDRVEDSDDEEEEIDFDAVKKAFDEDTDITVTLTSSRIYAKPTDTSTDELQKLCWNELSTGETYVYSNEKGTTYYVIYCITDDEEESKENAIEQELNSRRAEMFKEKYADIRENSSTFTVKSSIYNLIEYEAIKYKEVETSTTDESTSEEESSSDEGASDEETTDEDASDEETASDDGEDASGEAADSEETSVEDGEEQPPAEEGGEQPPAEEGGEAAPEGAEGAQE